MWSGRALSGPMLLTVSSHGGSVRELCESLIHKNTYLEKQLAEWKRVAKVKEEQNTELRHNIARLHSDMHTLERLKHED